MNTEIREANRYISNARELLENKAIRENGIYRDKKYVKMAGHTAYCGVLYALDQLIKSNSRSRKKSVDYYRAFLSTYDKKLLNEFNNLYDILHLSMGYEGNNNAKLAKLGISEAKAFIEKIGARLN